MWWFVRIARIPRFWHQELILAEKPRVRVATHNSSSASAQRRKKVSGKLIDCRNKAATEDQTFKSSF